MNNKEVIDYIQIVFNDVVNDLSEQGSYDEAFMFATAGKKAEHAVEYQDKYHWHDLRKNPNDLPEDNNKKYIVYAKLNDFEASCNFDQMSIIHEIADFHEGEFGYWEKYGDSSNPTTSFSCPYEEVFAWKELEEIW